jgi:hypothetical protein
VRPRSDFIIIIIIIFVLLYLGLCAGFITGTCAVKPAR